MVGPGGVLVTRMRCGVINLQFEGNWMPLTGGSMMSGWAEASPVLSVHRAWLFLRPHHHHGPMRACLACLRTV